METVACNLCDSRDALPFAAVPDLLLGRPHVRAELVRCRRCGLVYQNPRPSLTEMESHYPPEYEPYIDLVSARGSSWLARQAVAYGLRKRTRFVTRHKQGGALLDIGCAAGSFLVGMREVGNWEVCGVEISPAVAQIARERHGLNVLTGTLEEAVYADERFDAVTLWDVLEHLHDPVATLREIRRILKPDGLLVIRVPNLASWDARLFGAVWAGLDAPRHLYVFTPQTLSELLARSGFGVVDESCAIGGYVTFALSIRFWMTALGSSPAAQARAARLLYHPAARMASVPLFYLASRTRRGPLLVTTARRRL